jgi:hypothetical protein
VFVEPVGHTANSVPAPPWPVPAPRASDRVSTQHLASHQPAIATHAAVLEPLTAPADAAQLTYPQTSGRNGTLAGTQVIGMRPNNVLHGLL